MFYSFINIIYNKSMFITYKKSEVIEKGRKREKTRKKRLRATGILLLTIIPGLMLLELPFLLLDNKDQEGLHGFLIGLLVTVIYFVVPGIIFIAISRKNSSDLLLEGCKEYESIRRKNIGRVNSNNKNTAKKKAKMQGKSVSYYTYRNDGFDANELYDLLSKNDEVEYYDYRFDASTTNGHSKTYTPKKDDNDYEEYMFMDEMLDD